MNNYMTVTGPVGDYFLKIAETPNAPNWRFTQRQSCIVIRISCIVIRIRLFERRTHRQKQSLMSRFMSSSVTTKTIICSSDVPLNVSYGETRRKWRLATEIPHFFTLFCKNSNFQLNWTILLLMIFIFIFTCIFN